MAVLAKKLEVTHVHKVKNDKTILNDISFSVKNGEFLSILGPSGCGKTTLLRILIGLEDVTEGTLQKDGADITYLAPGKRGMGMVFQNYALFENMTVLENVEYALKCQKQPKESRFAMTLDMLKRMGLEEFKDRKPAGLSGGQQQRVALARTLVLNPDIILFDEPMSALDIATRLNLRTEIKQIQKEFGTTMIYVTHDQEEAFALSDRIMVMDKSIISQIGTPREISSSPANDYVNDFVVKNMRAKVDALRCFEG